MNPLRSTVFRLHFLAAVLACLPFASAEEFSDADLRFFEKNIRPLLAKNCLRCHSAAEGRVENGLNMDTRDGLLAGGERGPAIVPRKPAESLLIRAVHHKTKLRMPKKKLTGQQITLLTQWIARGAPDPRTDADANAPIETEIDYEKGREHWAYQPVANPRPPTDAKLDDPDWPRDALDRFVLARLESEGLAPVADATPEVLLRRLSFDLTGLPPSPAARNAFLAETAKGPKAAAQAIDALIDRLLASPAFGERWGRHWLDVARYAESNGMERNFTYPHAWRYRDYVIAAFNRDLPFDDFLTEQLAGDLLPDHTDEQLVATAFLAIGPKSLNNRDKRSFQMDVVDEQIDVTTRAFMGLTVACARCHDHKFDPVSMADYYAIAGIFKSSTTHYGTRSGNGNRQISSLMPIGSEQDDRAAKLAAHKKRVTEFTNKVNAQRKAVAQLNAKYKKAKGPDKVALKKDLDPARKLLAQKNKDLAALKKTSPDAPDYTMGITDAQAIAPCRINLRGDPHKLGPPVNRGFLKVIDGDVPATQLPNDTSGRRELAAWLTRPDHPLTARVTVNRVWHHLFGQGLVRTVDNFGATGETPTHPQLLDHLATRFVENDWSTKALIRDIVRSRTYQLASHHDPANVERDPDNRLLWRMNHRRLDADALRDHLLSVSGELVRTPRDGSLVTGPSANVGQNARLLASIQKQDFHRSIYQPILRNNVPEFLRVFDFAEPSILIGRRDVTTVPTQALMLMNSPAIWGRAEAFAARLNGKTSVEKIAHAYHLAFTRAPTKSETKRSLTFLNTIADDSAWPALCQALIASAEFRYLD